MAQFYPLRDYQPNPGFKKGDIFVLFGELFNRGYANGLIDQAKAAGMTIVGITVGRRDAQGTLRPLNKDELTAAEEKLGGQIINIPLWAGYDQDPALDGTTPVDQLSKVKTSNWQTPSLDWKKIEESKQAGIARFRSASRESLKQIENLIPQGANIFFAHTMAGGIPKAKIILVLTNRVVKGQGEKFMPSGQFWASEIGKLVEDNFYSVTANTFRELLAESASIRDKVAGWGGKVVYTAYGYHGTEIQIQNQLQWQSYNPYLQGSAKIRLEEIAEEYWQQGVRATVYNCPEIRTNSSDLFSGVELSLYPLVAALRKEGTCPWLERLEKDLEKKLNPSSSLEGLLQAVEAYHSDPVVQAYYRDFAAWPKHNDAKLADLMLNASNRMMAMNQNRKDVVTDLLSEVVVQSSGVLIFCESWEPHAPVVWLGHDLIAKERIAANR